MGHRLQFWPGMPRVKEKRVPAAGTRRSANCDGDCHSVLVHLHRVGNVRAVAAGNRDRDRDADGAAALQHHGVAAGEAVEGERETAEAVALVRVRAAR